MAAAAAGAGAEEALPGLDEPEAHHPAAAQPASAPAPAALAEEDEALLHRELEADFAAELRLLGQLRGTVARHQEEVYERSAGARLAAVAQATETAKGRLARLKEELVVADEKHREAEAALREQRDVLRRCLALKEKLLQGVEEDIHTG